MSLLGNIFTWWNGATIGTQLWTRRHGSRVGTDDLGNAYFESGDGKRWVIYEGANDASRVPPEWHSWLHHQIDGHPDEALPPPPKFLRQPTRNLTGTPDAYMPSGALDRGGVRQAASGDYQPWTPD